MERYTYFEGGKWRLRVSDTEHSGPWVDRLAAYEGTGLEPEQVKALGAKMKQIYSGTAEDIILDMKLLADHMECEKYRALGTVEELAALVKAQDEGRVVVLPCKPSDVTVYQLRSEKHALGVGVSPRYISATTVWANGDYALHHQGADDCLKKDLGKTWFLTRAEAEAALGGGGDG